jgi:hypothetical protein
MKNVVKKHEYIKLATRIKMAPSGLYPNHLKWVHKSLTISKFPGYKDRETNARQ